MSRTLLFKRIKKCFKMAEQANRLGLSDAELSAALTRRDFIKKAGTAALGAAVVANIPLSPEAFAQANANIAPVLILGGGAAGLAAAYQLRKAGVPFMICEWSDRLGGRIRTAKNFNPAGQFVELGAELVDTNHYTLIGLAAELGIDIEDFTAGDGSVDKELFYFNKRAYSEHEFVLAVRPLIAAISAARAEIYGDVDEYINAKTASLMPSASKYDAISLRQYLNDNASLAEAWVLEAVNVAYLCEYGLETEEQSSINLIDFIDIEVADGFSMFGASDESKRVKGGNENLIQAVMAKLALKENQDYITGARLLAMSDGQDEKIDCQFEVRGRMFTMSATNVICTLPFTTLRDVAGLKRGSKLLSGVQAEKIDCINDLGYGSNVKMMMSFKSRFWRDTNHAVPANNGSLFTEAKSQSFWETSRLQGGSSGILTNFTGGKRGIEIVTDTKSALDQALADLGLIYGVTLVREQYEERRVVMPWPSVPQIKGSYSCPRVGQYTTIWGYNADPESNNRLFFAGEHTHPLTYGFMNGAYNSGFRAANEVLVKLAIKPIEIPGRSLIAPDAEDGDN